MDTKPARRGIVILEGGIWAAVPDPLLDIEQIAWPPTAREKDPVARVKMLSAGDFYRRHEVVTGELIVFAKDSTLGK